MVTGTGYHWRCLDTVQQAAELLAAAPARLVAGAWLDKVPPPAWWPHRDRSGGQVVEQLTHVLDLARLLVGEVDAVWGAASRAPDSPGDADDATAVAARFASGAVGTFTASSLLPAKRRASLETVSADGLRLELSEQELVVERPGAEPEVLTPAVDGHEAVDREFLEAVAGRARVDPGAVRAGLGDPPARAGHGRRRGHRRAGPAVTLRLVLPGPGRAELVEEPDGELPAGRVRIATAFTGLSAGTELSWYKGSNPFLGRHFDAELGVFGPGEPASPYPVTRVGYMETGTVVESRTAALPVGTRVAAPYGHATGYVADPATEHVVPLPDDLDPVLGVYVAHMGPICANGVLHAAADAVGGPVRSLADGVAGRRVLVVGAGVVGLLTGLLAAEHGAADNA